MQRSRKINRANLLGIAASALAVMVLCTLQPTSLSSDSPQRSEPEASFLEEWWKAGQGNLWRIPFARFGNSEKNELHNLISWRADPLQWSSSDINDLSGFILEKTEEFNTSALLLVSLIDVESGFRSSAVSLKGAVGLMQVLPATAEEIARQSALSWKGPATLEDPKMNIEFGLRYLSSLKREFGSLDQVLTAYNIGPRALKRKLRAGEIIPSAYYQRVMGRMRAYEGRRNAVAGFWSGTWL